MQVKIPLQVYVFQSTPSVWRVTQYPYCSKIIKHSFQSTPSVWRVTCTYPANPAIITISIHTLRVEGDGIFLTPLIIPLIFQSTPSVWRVTSVVTINYKHFVFQSTPSVWRVTVSQYVARRQQAGFQSTPSVWRVTRKSTLLLFACSISIHTLRVEGDLAKITG